MLEYDLGILLALSYRMAVWAISGRGRLYRMAASYILNAWSVERRKTGVGDDFLGVRRSHAWPVGRSSWDTQFSVDSAVLPHVGFMGATHVFLLQVTFQFRFPAGQRLNCRVRCWARPDRSVGNSGQAGRRCPSATTKYGLRLGVCARSP